MRRRWLVAAGVAVALGATAAVGRYAWLPSYLFTLCTPGVRQAGHFLATVPDGPALPPALDLELAGNCAARPPAEDVRAEVTSFVEAVEKALGQRVLLYVGDDFADRYFRDLGGREQWVPSVLRRPGGQWRVWQASAWARVAGVEGPVDLDVRRLP